MNFKRTNKMVMENFLVPSGNQALASGELVTAGNAHNIANGQLGVLSWDHQGTRPLGEFIVAGETVANAKAVKLIQGTGKSNDLRNVDMFELGEKDKVESGIIFGKNVRSVSAAKYDVGNLSARAFHNFNDAESETEYGAYIRLLSQRRDQEYDHAEDVIFVGFETPNYTALSTAEPTDHLLQNFIYNINKRSREVVYGPGSALSGNKPMIALGVNFQGDNGKVVGTTEIGDTIDVQISEGYTTSITVTPAMLAAFAKLVVEGGIINASTFELIDLSTAGAAAKVDTMIVLGLDESPAGVFDDVVPTRVNAEVNLAKGFLEGADQAPEYKVLPLEAVGSGKELLVRFRDRAGLEVFTKQNQPFGDFFSRGVEYIDENSNYSVGIIEYYDHEQTLTLTEYNPKIAVIPITAQITTADLAVSAAVTSLNGGNQAVPTSSLQAATITSLNAILGAWLLSTDAELNGESTTGAVFV